jgi:hypothetical protein
MAQPMTRRENTSSMTASLVFFARSLVLVAVQWGQFIRHVPRSIRIVRSAHQKYGLCAKIMFEF